jgi:hypothetical protein
MTWIDIVVVAGSALAAVGLLALMVRWVPLHWREGDVLESGVNQFRGITTTLFAFVLGLSIVSALGGISKAGDTVTTEASALSDIYWQTRPLEAQQRDSVRALVRQYTQTVISEEWPLMERGQVSDRALTLYNELRRTVQDMRAATPEQAGLVRDSLVSVRKVGEARRLRVLAVSQEIPLYLWFGLFLFAFLLLLASVTRIPTLTVPGVAGTAVLGALLAMVMILLSNLNHPFGGGVHTEPDALRLALTRFADL